MVSTSNGDGRTVGRGRGRLHASGHITIVQEDRFLLLTDSGQALCLDLAHDAMTQPAELRRLQRAGERVDVEYEGEPGLASAGAHAVRPVGAADQTQSDGPG